MAGMTYYPISPLYWQLVREQGWGDTTAMLGAYLQTSRHRNLEGLFFHPVGYMAGDLRKSEQELEPHLAELESCGFVLVDRDADVVLLPDAMETYAPTSPKQVQGARKDLQLVPDTNLWGEFLLAAQKHAPNLFEALGGDDVLAEHLPAENRLSEPNLDPPLTHTHTHTPTHAEPIRQAA